MCYRLIPPPLPAHTPSAVSSALPCCVWDHTTSQYRSASSRLFSSVAVDRCASSLSGSILHHSQLLQYPTLLHIVWLLHYSPLQLYIVMLLLHYPALLYMCHFNIELCTITSPHQHSYFSAFIMSRSRELHPLSIKSIQHVLRPNGYGDGDPEDIQPFAMSRRMDRIHDGVKKRLHQSFGLMEHVLITTRPSTRRWHWYVCIGARGWSILLLSFAQILIQGREVTHFNMKWLLHLRRSHWVPMVATRYR